MWSQVQLKWLAAPPPAMCKRDGESSPPPVAQQEEEEEASTGAEHSMAWLSGWQLLQLLLLLPALTRDSFPCLSLAQQGEREEWSLAAVMFNSGS